ALPPSPEAGHNRPRPSDSVFNVLAFDVAFGFQSLTKGSQQMLGFVSRSGVEIADRGWRLFSARDVRPLRGRAAHQPQNSRRRMTYPRLGPHYESRKSRPWKWR